MRMHTSPPAADGTPELDLLQLWGVLRRQWWILACGALLGTGAAALLVARPEPLYDASTLIRVQEQGGGMAGLTLGSGSHLETEMQVIRSRTVVGAVVDSLQLQLRLLAPEGVSRDAVLAGFRLPADAAPGTLRLIRASDELFTVSEADTEQVLGTARIGQEMRLGGVVLVLADGAAAHPEIQIGIRSRERAVDALVAALEITRPTRNADIIRVGYRDGDPVMARDVVNAVVERFLHFRDDAQKTEVRSTIGFLSEQIDAVSLELTSAEDRLRSFRERAQVIDPGVEGSTQVRRLAELQAERSSLHAERQSLQQLVREIESAPAPPLGAPSPYRRLAAFPAMMRSSVFSEVLRSLTVLEGERAVLLTRRRDSDQDVEVLTARIALLEEQLKTFVTTYLSGLSSQIASIDGGLATYGGQIARLPANEVEFARLSRQPALLGEMYAILQTRLQEAQVSQAVQDGRVRVVDQAVLPPTAVNAGTWKLKYLAISCLGLLLGLTVGFVREFADASIYTRGDVQTAIGVPVLGLVPRLRRGTRRALTGEVGKPLVPALLGHHGNGARGGEAIGRGHPRALGSGNRTRGGSQAVTVPGSEPPQLSAVLISGGGPTPYSDAYDRLHTNILFALADAEPCTLLLTSALPGDGKTSTAANLAIATARRGLRTLVIDADLRRGSLSTVFGGARAPGLTELLAGTVTLPEVIQSVEVADTEVHYIASGAFPSNPSGVVGSREMRALLERLAPHFDRILLDSPPVNIVTDAVVLAPYVDGVVLVARAGVTPHAALALAAEQLRHARVQLVGAVLNGVDFARHATHDPAYASYAYGKKYYAKGVA
jgi:capsular exopolysaccharide synthesis family protein